MMVEVLTHVSPYVLGAVACVCKAWRAVVEAPRLWRQACGQAFKQQFDQEAMAHEATTTFDQEAMAHEATTTFDNIWKIFFMVRPHLRFDGIFVSRNTYCRVGVIEMRERKPVHLVCYYRYWRFFDDGTLNYRTSPLTVSKVAKSLRPRLVNERSMNRDRYYSGDNTVFKGRWILKGSKLFVVIVYPNSRSTEIRMVLKLRSTTQGANNRLDISSIISYDRELGAGTSMIQNAEDELLLPDPLIEAAPPVPGKEHNRGLSTASLVPWDQVSSSILNLPPDKMDFYRTG